MESTTPAILEVGLVLLGAVGAGWLARRISLPAIVGYLAVGIVLSPFTPGLVADRHQLELFADVGVVLLLFEVGIEVDLGRIRREHGALLWLAPLQTILTTVIGGLAFMAVGLPPLSALVVGLCIALSSSVVIVNMTRSRRRTTDRPTEVALLGWSVLQDITGVTLAAVLLAAIGLNGRPLAESLAGLGAFLVLTLVTARVVPFVLRALRGQSDFFLVVSVASGLTLAGLGSAVFGVPLALAAFVGGLAITDSHEAAEARRRLLPFRDLFAVLFFVAIGTLVDPGELSRSLGWLGLLLGLVVVAKVGAAYVLARLGRVAARPAQLAVGLGQIGEFSFVLAAAMVAANEITDQLFVAIVASVATTIAFSTVLVRLPFAAPPGGPDEAPAH